MGHLSSAELLEAKRKLEPHLQRFGISRVGDLTGLDTIGVPVWFACRPNSRSLTVAQGKGTSHEAAWISAVGESIESAVAETADFALSQPMSMAEAQLRGFAPIDLSMQARCDETHLGPNEKLTWVSGTNLRTRQSVVAPYELVGMDMRMDATWNRTSFRMSSTGLACHFNCDTAICHALEELIEDDALETVGPRSKRPPFLIDRKSTSQQLQDIEACISHNGFGLAFHQINTLIDVPVIRATLKTLGTNEDGHPEYMGCACAESVSAAALPAALEAIQTRLTLIAGSRDDLQAKGYQHFSFTTPWLWPTATLCLKEPASNKNASLRLKALMEKLRDGEVENVYVFKLASFDFGLHVVRVLADNLLSPARPPQQVYSGEKAKRMMRGWMA
jgi:ribosomal protein S12 methylthiotransferase accessory factor